MCNFFQWMIKSELITRLIAISQDRDSFDSLLMLTRDIMSSPSLSKIVINSSSLIRQKIPLKLAKDPSDGDFDAIVVLALAATSDLIPSGSAVSKYLPFIQEVKLHDDFLEKDGGFILLPESEKTRRLIYSPVGPVNRDQDDVRRFRDAAYRGIKRALKSKSIRPIICIPFVNSQGINYPLYDVAVVLGAYEVIYTVSRSLFSVKK